MAFTFFSPALERHPVNRAMACTNRHFSLRTMLTGPLRYRLSIHYKIIPLKRWIVKHKHPGGDVILSKRSASKDLRT